MTAILGFTLLVLWVSCTCGHGYPNARTYGYNYPTYNHHHHSTYQKSPCSAATPCYQRMLTYTRDGIPDFRPNPDGFIYHHKRAGLDKYAIIVEGKRAAKYFHYQYGVDVGYLPDEAYLTPNITLSSGIRFDFGVKPAAGKRILNVATQGATVQLINSPLSTASWRLFFPVDYYSNGAFKGHIPAGSYSLFGSYVFDVCPDESLYNPCRSTLSRKRKGQVVIKFRSTTFFTLGRLDQELKHEQWGQGRLIGAFVTTYDGVDHERAVLTFPSSLH